MVWLLLLFFVFIVNHHGIIWLEATVKYSLTLKTKEILIEKKLVLKNKGTLLRHSMEAKTSELRPHSNHFSSLQVNQLTYVTILPPCANGLKRKTEPLIMRKMLLGQWLQSRFLPAWCSKAEKQYCPTESELSFSSKDIARTYRACFIA